jgi:hypothetical protein
MIEAMLWTGAVKSDGRKYRCSRPRGYTFRHISVSRKSSQKLLETQKLLEIAASMLPVIRSDLRPIDCY